MSFDVYFVDRSYVGSWNDAMEALESSTAQEPEWSDEDEQRWTQVTAAFDPPLGGSALKDTASSHTLEDPESLVRLVAHPGSLSMHVPYSAGPMDRIVEVLNRIASTVESTTSLVAYDPQSKGAFLEEGATQVPRIFAQSRQTLERLVGPVGDLWQSRGTLVSLSADELADLRSTKGDRARRAHAAELLGTHPPSRTLRMGEAWTFINMLCGGDPDRSTDGLGLFVGQRLHRGGSQEITLLKSLSDQVAQMTDIDEAEVARLILEAGEDGYRRLVPTSLAQDWETAGITDIVTEARADNAAQTFTAIREFLGQAVEAEESVLFLVDHYALGPKRLGF